MRDKILAMSAAIHGNTDAQKRVFGAVMPGRTALAEFDLDKIIIKKYNTFCPQDPKSKLPPTKL